MVTKRDILVKAKEFVSKPENWCQGHLETDGSFCFVGAIYHTTDEWPGEKTNIYSQLDETFWENIAKGVGIPTVANGKLAMWNDALERKHQDILDAFDRCINLFGKDDNSNSA